MSLEALRKHAERATTPKNGIETIYNSAYAFVASANQGQRGTRVIPQGTAKKIVQRSLKETTDQPLSVRKHQALKALSEYAQLAQKNKAITASAKNTDLLPVAHPESTKAHNISLDVLNKMEARWYADDPNIKDESTRSLVYEALTASAGSDKALYTVSRIENLPAGSVPQDILIAVTEQKTPEPLLAWGIPGVNVSARARRRWARSLRAARGKNSRAARSLRAKRQTRDRKGRFAFEGGLLSGLFDGLFKSGKRGGARAPGPARVSAKIVGQNPDRGRVEVELPDGRIFSVPANKTEFSKARLPGGSGNVTPAGKISISEQKDVISLNEVEQLEAPSGFTKDLAWKPSPEDRDFYGSNTDLGTLYSDDMYEVLKFDKANAPAKDKFEIAQQKDAEGQDILTKGDGPDGELDPNKPVFFVQRKDGQGRVFGVVQSWADVQNLAEADMERVNKNLPPNPKEDAKADLSQEEPGFKPGDIFDSPEELEGLPPGSVVKQETSVGAESPEKPATRKFQKSEDGSWVDQDTGEISDPKPSTPPDSEEYNSEIEVESVGGEPPTPPESPEVSPAGDVDPNQQAWDNLKEGDEISPLVPFGKENDGELSWVPDGTVVRDSDDFDWQWNSGDEEWELIDPKKPPRGMDGTKRSQDFDDNRLELVKKGEGPINIPEPPEPEETPEPSPEPRPAPEGFYPVDPSQPYEPEGPTEGQTSSDFTDDPTELAQRYSEEQLEQSLEDAVSPDGDEPANGFGSLPFEDGDEPVPAEAIYEALEEKGADADGALARIYSGEAETTEPEAPEEAPAPSDAPVKAEPGAMTVKEFKEIVKNPPPLIDSLTKDELQDVLNNDFDYTRVLPENRSDFDVPEGYYEMDPDALPSDENLNPEDIAGLPVNAFDLAVDADTEKLEVALRESLSPEASTPGYAQMTFDGADGEEYSVNIPAEAIRDALQMQGIDTNEMLDEIYGVDNITDEDVDAIVDGEGIDLDELEGDSDVGEEEGPEPEGDQPEAGPEGQGTIPEAVREPEELDGRGDRDGSAPWVSLDSLVARSGRGQELIDEGITPDVEIYELDPERDAPAFRDAISKLRENNKYAASVYVYEEDEYRNMRLFMSADGTAGFALKDGDEIVSVFVHSDSPHKGASRLMIAEAVANGGKRLDAFDTVLPGIYASEGFRVIARVRWNDQYKPEGWDYNTFGKFNEGRPDVVFMSYDADRVGDEYDGGEGAYFFDYDSAYNANKAFADGELSEVVGERTFDITNWEQYGPQAGSNKGGFFRDSEGNEYYVKYPKSDTHASNEALASALYEEAGVNYGGVYRGVDAEGNTVLVSPLLEGVSYDFVEKKNNEDVLKKAQSGFVVDAWLNNWDSVGLQYDNMVMVGDDVFRVDPGGALLFRAQGDTKKDDLTPEVDALESMRDAKRPSGQIFGGMTDAELAEDAKKVEGISPEKIDELVDKYFSDDPETAGFLKERLRSRREDILSRFESEEVEEEASEFGKDAVSLNPEGDLVEQIQQAMDDQKEVEFFYDGENRLVKGIAIQTNINTGNTLFLTVDADSQIKTYNLAKIQAKQDVPEIPDFDGPGTETDKPEVLPEQAVQTLNTNRSNLVTKVFESDDDVTTDDLKDYSEEEGVDSDYVTDVVKAIDSPESSYPVAKTPEEKATADAVQESLEGGQVQSIDSLLEDSKDPKNFDPDLIWQEVIDRYDGNVLENAHIVVQSVMHGDYRFDVLVRRNSDETFQVYHRVTDPEGGTKVKVMEGRWHSGTALFSRIDQQMNTSKTNPSLVTKYLKKENEGTLKASVDSPKQEQSFVAADGTILQKGMRIKDSDGRTGRIVRAEKEYTVKAKNGKVYTYTDYLRIAWDDGKKNWKVSTNVVPEDNDFPPGWVENKGDGKSSTLPTPKAPEEEEILEDNPPVDIFDTSVDENTPAWDSTRDRIVTLLQKKDLGLEVEYYVNEGSSPYLKELEARELIKKLEALPNLPGVTDEELGVPLSWSEASKDSSGKELNIQSSYSAVALSGTKEIDKEAFGGEDGFDSLETLNKEYKKAYGEGFTFTAEADGKVYPVLPGFLFRSGESVGIIDDVDVQSRRISVSFIDGPLDGKRYTNISPKEGALDPTMHITQENASFLLNVNYDASSMNNKIEEARRLLTEGPSVYQSKDMIKGPGFEPSEISDIDWSYSITGENSLSSVLNQLSDFSTNESRSVGASGKYVAFDSSSVEDGQVLVQKIVDQDFQEKIRVSGRLTDWEAEQLIKNLAERGVIPRSELSIRKMDVNAETGALERRDWDLEFGYDAVKGGESYYLGEYGDADFVLHRSVKSGDSPNFFQHGGSSEAVVSFHNTFELLLPADVSPEDVQRAFEEVGISNSRPATDEDMRKIAENKLLWLLGSFTDGKYNASGVLREQELQKIEQKYGITVGDVAFELTKDPSQRIQFLLPESFADKIIEETGAKYFYQESNAGDAGTPGGAATVQAVVERLGERFRSGKLISIVSRWWNGVNTKGMSSPTDVRAAGGSYVFTRPIDELSDDYNRFYYGGTRVAYVFDARQLLRRFDYYANVQDSYGQLKDNRHNPIETLRESIKFYKKNREQNRSSEVMFKNDIDFQSSLVKIYLPAGLKNDKDSVVKELKDSGIDQINGIPIEEIVDVKRNPLAN